MKTAVITGGTKGIGYGIAEAMLSENMNVVITGRNQDTVDEAVQRLSKSGKGKVLGIASDVRSLTDEQNVINSTIATFGSVDILIANAGVGHFASIEDMTPEQWQQTIDVNLTGVFNSIKAGIEALKASKGYFITIASLAGTNFFARGAAYNASKFGLVGMTQAIMLDLRQYGIKTTTIMPGSVSTHFNGNQPSENDAWKIQPEDIGQMVIDLLKMHPRTLPSKVEVRPTMPGRK